MTEDSRSLSDRPEPRRYLALLQDERGYGKLLEPAPPEGPSQPVLFTVVKADDHEAEVERLRAENERLHYKLIDREGAIVLLRDERDEALRLMRDARRERDAAVTEIQILREICRTNGWPEFAGTTDEEKPS